MYTESTVLSNALTMVEACRQELEKRGFTTQAAMLKGVEIFDETDAQLTLASLQQMTGVTGSAGYARKSAIQLLKRALHPSSLPIAC